MKLIVGLGNPGPEYAHTRHNAGFMAIDRLLARHAPAESPKSRFHSRVYDTPVAGQRCLLIQPMTFMNRSGLAVGEAARFYKLDPADLIILVDDINLPVGRIRLRADGGPGGHNGLIDIERALSSRDYPRLRIGVDAPGRARQTDYVLGRFAPDQADALDDSLNRAADAVETWLTDGIDLAMTRHNAPA